MDTHNFMLILDSPIDEATSDLLFEAGLDDAAITAFDGHPALDVDREAPTLLDAIASAVTQAESVATSTLYASKAKNSCHKRTSPNASAAPAKP